MAQKQLLVGFVSWGWPCFLPPHRDVGKMPTVLSKRVQQHLPPVSACCGNCPLQWESTSHCSLDDHCHLLGIVLLSNSVHPRMEATFCPLRHLSDGVREEGWYCCSHLRLLSVWLMLSCRPTPGHPLHFPVLAQGLLFTHTEQ